MSVSQKESAREYNMVSTLVWAMQRAAHSKTPVYTYLWDRPLPGPKREVYGAFHSSELPYVFNRDEGRYEDGKWVAGRRLNGDEVGQGLPDGGVGMLRIKLIRFD